MANGGKTHKGILNTLLMCGRLHVADLLLLNCYTGSATLITRSECVVKPLSLVIERRSLNDPLDGKDTEVRRLELSSITA